MNTPDFAAINAAFQALSPGEKRRAVAQDVLERLARKQLIPERGWWVQTRCGDWNVDAGADLQSFLNDANVTCTVCAIGGAIVALAHFEDAISVGEACFKNVQHRLFGLLGEEQTRLMECAFEEGGGDNLAAGLDLRYEAVSFGLRYPDAKDRFTAIWTAIANHPEGLFDVVALNAAAEKA